MTALTASQRQAVLSIASCITADRHDPASVIANAGPLIAWAEEAADDADAHLRISALHQWQVNTPRSMRCLDCPDQVITQAGQLYEFAVSGGP